MRGTGTLFPFSIPTSILWTVRREIVSVVPIAAAHAAKADLAGAEAIAIAAMIRAASALAVAAVLVAVRPYGGLPSFGSRVLVGVLLVGRAEVMPEGVGAVTSHRRNLVEISETAGVGKEATITV